MHLETIWNRVKDRALQHKEEFLSLLELMKKRDVKKVLEIGCYKGGSTEGFLSLGCQVVSIDIEKQPEIESLEKLYPYLFIKGTSKDYSCTEMVFDMLYIDAGHTYEACKEDFHNCVKYVKLGGMVVFHDIISFDGQNHYGSAMFWEEIKKGQKTLEIIKAGTTKESHEWGAFGVLFV